MLHTFESKVQVSQENRIKCADFRTKRASFTKKNEKSVQKLAKVCKSWYVLSRN